MPGHSEHASNWQALGTSPGHPTAAVLEHALVAGCRAGDVALVADACRVAAPCLEFCLIGGGVEPPAAAIRSALEALLGFWRGAQPAVESLVPMGHCMATVRAWRLRVGCQVVGRSEVGAIHPQGLALLAQGGGQERPLGEDTRQACALVVAALAEGAGMLCQEAGTLDGVAVDVAVSLDGLAEGALVLADLGDLVEAARERGLPGMDGGGCGVSFHLLLEALRAR